MIGITANTIALYYKVFDGLIYYKLPHSPIDVGGHVCCINTQHVMLWTM